ncbi:Mad3/BUB1 homology region 1-domain-containing protein [Mycena galericulata]|nr:Mad3/BUB1 homology region 1-domain-containing protein [Mycena galericulata]
MATEDVFSDTPNIVDFDVLEAAKENVQPLATGRRATALSAILSTPHAQRESKLAATRNRLRINVEIALEDEEDDPLEAYWRLVNWTVENYPQGQSAESGLVELLEEATRVLKDNREGKWRGEIKYLKLWLLYTSFVEKPTIIYNFLIANEIGTDFALLYEELAAVQERDGRRKEADDAYVLGIARRAAPLDHLKGRHIDFQKRMMCAPPLPALPVLPAAPASVTEAIRPALASTSAATTSSFPLSTPAVSRDSRAVAGNARLQVLADLTSEFSDAAGNAFPDVGTRKTRVKENVPKTTKMTGSTLRQPGKTKRLASGAASAPTFMPYVDSEAEAMPPPPSIPTAKKTRDTVPQAPSKIQIEPFVDEEVDTNIGGVPSTPTFVPFQDEVRGFRV